MVWHTYQERFIVRIDEKNRLTFPRALSRLMANWSSALLQIDTTCMQIGVTAYDPIAHKDTATPITIREHKGSKRISIPALFFVLFEIEEETLQKKRFLADVEGGVTCSRIVIRYDRPIVDD